MKKTSICIVNKQGEIVHESEVKTDPKTLADSIEIKYDMNTKSERIAYSLLVER